MAWTTPRTWSDGELVTASIMNTDIRDNLNTVWHLIARKTSDQTVTSSVTYVADTALIAPVGASEVWQLRWILRYDANTTADLKFRFTFPSAGTISYSYVFPTAGGTLVAVAEHDTSTPGPDSTASGDGAGNLIILPVEMVYVGGNSGNVALEWAQDTSDVGGTIMKAQSTVWGQKVG